VVAVQVDLIMAAAAELAACAIKQAEQLLREHIPS
jgi:hypothetical protein